MDTPSPSPTSRLWLAWIGAVIVGPALGFAWVTNDSKSDSGFIGLVGFCGASWLVHVITSVALAKRIASNRADESRHGSAVGLTIGLLFGGWAIIGAVFFVGCLSTLTFH